ncbi:MAG: malate dehydrogenase [Deltaproteobacteria bacterium]|nr:malate dehydrogenase [Deltaproteobacteria bacterium]
MRKKLTIVGSGFVGATCAHWALAKELCDVVLIDIDNDITRGKALDLFQASPVLGSDCKVVGGSDYDLTKNSDVVVITAGLPRKPGMSRDELLSKNASIVKAVTEQIVKYSPKCILVVVSNPLDAMAYVAYKVSRFPKERVIGMAGVLDSARFRSFIAQELDVSVEDVHGFVLGGHGDTMVPVVEYCSVGGIPLTQLLSTEKLNAIVDRTRNGGAEMVSLLKTGSAYTAPSASVIAMVESILKDKKRVLPVAAYLDGEYGVKGYFVGVLAKLGSAGIEKIYELKLQKEAQAHMDKSVDHVKALVSQLSF